MTEPSIVAITLSSSAGLRDAGKSSVSLQGMNLRATEAP
jgi:hypothetical protein